MAIGITKVPGVDPPGTVVRLVGESCARRSSALEQRVHVSLGRNDVTDAEPAARPGPKQDIRILRQFGAWIESKNESVDELEHHDVSGGGELVAGKRSPDHTGRLEPEAVAIELERATEVAHSECDHVNARIHSLGILPTQTAAMSESGRSGNLGDIDFGDRQ